jgi:two-component system, NtrC family, sensor kinase
MEQTRFLSVFEEIGRAFNSSLGTVATLEVVARAVVGQLELKACHFRLLSRDQRVLEHVAAFGVSERYLNKGPVDAERSVAEALKGRTVYVADCSTDARIQYPIEMAQEGIVSVLTVPLRTRGQVIGIMRLGTRERREFSPDEIQAIEVIASLCSTAVTHSMFHQILRHVTQSIRSSLDLDEVLHSITRVIAEDLRAKGCFLKMLDSEGRLRVRAAYGLSQRFLGEVEGEPSAAAAQALKGECVAIPDAGHDPRVPWSAAAREERFASLLYVPLMVRSQAIGLLGIATHHPYDFSEDEISLLAAIAEECGLAIRTAQMYGSMKHRYESVVEDFHQWFEHYHVFPPRREGE